MNKQKDIWKENSWKTTSIVLITIILTILLSFMVSAIPLPKGIDGKVYELDGVTEIFEPVSIQIINIDTQEIVVGLTGKGSNGRYSASLNWDIGTSVEIIVSNGYNKASRQVILQGSMHDVDLVLNNSYPPLPPEIISEPILNATQDELYAYLVKAKDLNKDKIIFSLIQAPQGMIIDNETGLITWKPNNENIGANTVIIEVSDGQFSNQQIFSIFVQDVNDAPIIISSPKLDAQTNTLYYYWVKVSDEEDNYQVSILQGPRGMLEFQSVILWRPTVSQVGTHPVLIQVKDSFGEVAIQEYNITVTYLSRGGGRGRANDLLTSTNSDSSDFKIAENDLSSALDKEYRVIEETITAKNIFEFSNSVPIRIVEKLFIEDNGDSVSNLKEDTITLSTTNKLQNSIITLNAFVYSYITMSSQNEKANYKITFAIDSKWLEDRKINKEDVRLYVFSQGKWVSLQTQYIMQNDEALDWNLNETYFVSQINKEQISDNKIQWFALSHDLNVGYSLPNPSFNYIKEPFSFYGVVQSDGRNVNPKLVDLEFINKNNDEKYSASIFSTPSGSTGYQTTLQGNKGDEVEIYLKSKKNQLIKEIYLDDNIIREDLELRKTRSLLGVTGYVVGDTAYIDPLSFVAFFVLIIIIGGLFVYHHKVYNNLEKEKSKNKKKNGGAD